MNNICVCIHRVNEVCRLKSELYKIAIDGLSIFESRCAHRCILLVVQGKNDFSNTRSCRSIFVNITFNTIAIPLKGSSIIVRTK